MAEHGDAAEQIDEQTPPDEGTDVDDHDTDADLAENAEMPAPQRFSDTRALITVGFVILAALAVWRAGSDTASTRTARRKRSAINTSKSPVRPRSTSPRSTTPKSTPTSGGSWSRRRAPFTTTSRRDRSRSSTSSRRCNRSRRAQYPKRGCCPRRKIRRKCWSRYR
jgi:hypothetical protein